MTECPRPEGSCPYENDRTDLRAAAREMTEAAVTLRLLAEEWRTADAPQRLTRLETQHQGLTRRLDWHQRTAIATVAGLCSLVGWFGSIRGWW